MTRTAETPPRGGVLLRHAYPLPASGRRGEHHQQRPGGDDAKNDVSKEAQRQSDWFDQEIAKLDSWAEDKRTGLKFDLRELDDQLKELKRQIRQTGTLPEKLTLQRKARDIEKKRDDAWRTYDEAAKQIEVEKDALLDRVEEQLAQTVATEDLFTITFQID